MKLSLYGYPACPYCAQVLRVIARLEAPVEFRDILVEPAYGRELAAAQGSRTVPVLRIEGAVSPAANGSTDEASDKETTSLKETDSVRWMPESTEIIAFLYEHFGDGKTPPLIDSTLVQRAVSISMWTLLAAGLAFVELQPVLWMVACALGAIRSFVNGVRTRAWYHFAIGTVFLFGCTAIGLNAQGIADIPWWYAAYGLVGLILAVTLVLRFRAARRSS